MRQHTNEVNDFQKVYLEKINPHLSDIEEVHGPKNVLFALDVLFRCYLSSPEAVVYGSKDSPEIFDAWLSVRNLVACIPDQDEG